MDNEDLTRWFRHRHVETRISAILRPPGEKCVMWRTGDSSDATILFIHGAPSSMSYWRNYLTDSILVGPGYDVCGRREAGYGYSRFGRSGAGHCHAGARAGAVTSTVYIKAHHRDHCSRCFIWRADRLPAWLWIIRVDGLVTGLAPPIGPGREDLLVHQFGRGRFVHWLYPGCCRRQTGKRSIIEELTKMLPFMGGIRS